MGRNGHEPHLASGARLDPQVLLRRGSSIEAREIIDLERNRRRGCTWPECCESASGQLTADWDRLLANCPGGVAGFPPPPIGFGAIDIRREWQFEATST